MGAAVAPNSSAIRVAASALVGALLLLAGLASVLVGLPQDCSTSATAAAPSAAADRTIPADYLTLYERAGQVYGVPWTVLAAIGAIESDHGRSHAPGVQSGVNAYGCCAGPMQFNLRDGPPSTWQRWRVDGDGDGRLDPYAPADAIASAGRYLQALVRQAGGDVARAVLGYNHSSAYVADVLARARAYGDAPDAELAATQGASPSGCSSTSAAPPATLRGAERVKSPRAYALLPACCAHTICASPRPAKAATTPTGTAPPSTSCRPNPSTRPPGTSLPARSRERSAGHRHVELLEVGRPARSSPRSSSSATRDTRDTDHRGLAPHRVLPTSTFPGRRRATAPARHHRHAPGS
jgi:hypothetical protein